MRTFQGLLKRLESGQMSIHMCMEHACNFELGKESGIPAEHWQEALKDAVVWMDYLSMPQPNAKEIKRRQSITPTAEVQEALSARATLESGHNAVPEVFKSSFEDHQDTLLKLSRRYKNTTEALQNTATGGRRAGRERTHATWRRT